MTRDSYYSALDSANHYSPLPAVILAAGLGSRLGEACRDVPKSLVPVLGRPLLSYTMQGLAQAGVREVHVVVGHRGDQIRDRLLSMDRYGLDVGVVYNPRFSSPNGSSLAAARNVVSARPFLLVMADHLLSAEAIRRMLGASFEFAVGLDCTDLSSERLDDATKVLLDDEGRVCAFGKRLPRWHGVDAGIFRCTQSVFAVIDAVGCASELSTIMTAVAAERPFHAVDLTGAFWLDVDTPRDLEEAELLLQQAGPGT
jgi:1L-myo-inositol 1-phosphate cytidylyltransferase